MHINILMHTTFRLFSNYFKILTIYGSASNYDYATLLTSVKVHEGVGHNEALSLFYYYDDCHYDND